jgi:hypothetical protein
MPRSGRNVTCASVRECPLEHGLQSGAVEDAGPVIAVAELRLAVERLLDAVVVFDGQINLGADYYWSIFPSDAFKMDSHPPIAAGQLTDDVDTIRELLSRADRSEDPLSLWHDLEHLVGILQRVSNLAGAG